ncbi:MAG: helix-turn-helix transcriptional regulator [Armatimonadetes bacterium]|nr:helix-turn-helix transcriptional regulator [Armatimonadota bacterium]
MDTTLDKPEEFHIPTKPNTFVLSYFETGNMITRRGSEQLHFLTPKRFYCGTLDEPVIGKFSRGRVKGFLAEIHEKDIPLLAVILNRRMEAQECGLSLSSFTSTKSLDTVIELHEMAIGTSHENLMAAIHSILSIFCTMDAGSCDAFELAPIPESIVGTLRDLLYAVQKEPNKDWNLKDSAEQAAYSQCHLSRAFKNLTGYCFPEFVERTRAEHAIRFLLNSEIGLNQIQLECGFGSAQAMRNALRTHTGFLPSEFRTKL